MVRFDRAFGMLAAAGLLVGLSFAPAPAAAARHEAEIVRTDYGVPHVTARDFRGLGYGQAYAYAQDNLCLIADKIVTVNGERSRYFGTDSRTVVAFQEVANIEADFFFKGHIDIEALRAGFGRASRDYRDLVAGYAAGFNRYLKDTPQEQRPEACRNAAWVRRISVDDLLRLNEERMIQASGGAWLRQANAATPPPLPPTPAMGVGLPNSFDEYGLGSNGWAFGRAATANGSGLLLGNPHFPWETTNRFYELHLTIPGRLDAMGVTIAGAPGLSIGFNRDVAWTHTVSTDRHFTLFELQIDPTDPTAYLVDGKSERMTRKVVTVETPAGSQSRTYFASRWGPIVSMPQAGLDWTRQRAYALADANRSNTRSGDTWLAIVQARSVGDIREAISSTLGIPWVNTIAADRHGDVLYADITATPHVTDAKLLACAPSPEAARLAVSMRLYVLNGARASCAWDVSEDAAAPGLFPAEAMPALVRQDYVANSNDSYWLANGEAPMAAFPAIIGLAGTPQNLRTRAGLTEIRNRLAEGRLDGEAVKAMLYANRNHAADLFLDEVLTLCTPGATGRRADGAEGDLSEACRTLAGWDRRMDAQSRGAMLFVEFWRGAEKIPDLYAVPFDPAAPAATPRGLKLSGPTAQGLKDALAEAAALLESRGLALDAPYGDLHLVERNGEKIPIHGGEGAQGVLNAQQSRWVDGLGYVPVHGSSYIQVVTFDERGPVADAILSYAQSTDPASPHYADQTRLYSAKTWVRLPFHKADVAGRATGPALKLEE